MKSTKFYRVSSLGLAVVLALMPCVAHAWWNDQWTQRKPMRIDTSAKGVILNESIGPTPMLVRLHLGNFRFEAANQDGSDLRFIAGDDQTLLAYHIESYDSLLGEALIWLGLPELKAGASTEFWLYFGNPKAIDAQDAKGTYDPKMTLVYHFSESAKPLQDMTTWSHHSSEKPSETTNTLIGRGLRLDGKQPVTIPKAPALAWEQGGNLTWSAWVRPAEDNSTGVIFSRSDDTSALIIGLEKGLAYVEIQRESERIRVKTEKSLKAANWAHFAVVVDKKLSLFLDGDSQDSVDATLPSLDGPSLVGGLTERESSSDKKPEGELKKGDSSSSSTADKKEAYPTFRGDLDELQMANVARPAEFFKIAAISQGMDPKRLFTCGQDEEAAGWSSGYMTIIISSVTLDGWIVIIMLAVMSVISWMIMVGKSSTLSSASKANEQFTILYSQMKTNLVKFIDAPEASAALSKKKVLKNSPLLKVFLIAADEFRRRTKSNRALSAENLAAIRTSLDTGCTHENQRLSSRMVLLTIAISGGPFLGLLGTVVGVMITFASIAAAGDVNVNAIAPGIAAALVATIAGLAVAIPALFGYNWLLARLKDITTTMRVFTDELLAQAAEAYAERARAVKPPPFSVDNLGQDHDSSWANQKTA